MTDNPPDWARVEAMKRLNAELGDGVLPDWKLPRDGDVPEVLAMARLIAKHEQPPADPDLETAREAAARDNDRGGLEYTAAKIRNGHSDDDPDVQLALAAIKLHKERNP